MSCWWCCIPSFKVVVSLLMVLQPSSLVGGVATHVLFDNRVCGGDGYVVQYGYKVYWLNRMET